MRVATCIHKNNRLALCESERCNQFYKGCTKTQLFNFIDIKQYLFILDRVMSQRVSIAEVLKAL